MNSNILTHFLNTRKLNEKLFEDLFDDMLEKNLTIAKQLNLWAKMNQGKMAYIAGMLDSWAVTIKENPELISNVVTDMQHLADSLKKSAGVTVNVSQ